MFDWAIDFCSPDPFVIAFHPVPECLVGSFGIYIHSNSEFALVIGENMLQAYSTPHYYFDYVITLCDAALNLHNKLGLKRHCKLFNDI